MTVSKRSADYACAIVLRQGRVLLGRRAGHRVAYPGCWDVIGGKVEAGETPEQALTRELGEEIGILPRHPTYFDRLSDTAISATAPPTYHFFKVCEWDGGEPAICNHEHTRLEWYDAGQLNRLTNLALPEYRKLLRAALA